MNEDFFTITSYLHENKALTYAMEDYLEMIYRQNITSHNLTITKLSTYLNIKKPSCSKMVAKLKELEFVSLTNNYILLTKKGEKIGKYLFHRHHILETFLKKLNQQDFKLAQVEKLEHFIDYPTLQNIAKLLPKL